MHCGLVNKETFHMFYQQTRSPRNNSLVPYLSCRSSVIPIATPQRWQISAGVARTRAHTDRRRTTCRFNRRCKIDVGLFKITRHSRVWEWDSRTPNSLHGERRTPGVSWRRARSVSHVLVSVCLSVCLRLRGLSACGLCAHYQNKQRWGWKNGIHTLNKTGKNQTPARHRGIVSTGARRLSQGTSPFSWCRAASCAPANSIKSRFSPLRL